MARDEGLRGPRPGRRRDEDVQPDDGGRRPGPRAARGSGASSSRACAGSASSACRCTSPTTSIRTSRRRRRCRRFDELVREGHVGAVGASNFTADQLAEALELSALEGLARYEWVQNAFSLLEQDDRETVFPLCHEHGLGYTPFSPLAGGWLTGKYRRGEPPPSGSRMTLRPEGSERFRTDATFDALEELERLAAGRGASLAALALAWLLEVPEVTAVVVGPNTVAQLAPVREALALRLRSDDRARIEAIAA